MFEPLLQWPQCLLGHASVKSGVIGCSGAKQLLLVSRVGAELRCCAVGRRCKTDPVEAVRDGANFNIPDARISISPLNVVVQLFELAHRLSIRLKQHFLFQRRQRLNYPQLFPKRSFSATGRQL
jgi:hypothetical protein